MSDYEETARLVADGELKEWADEMRSVHITDGTTTIVDIQIKSLFAPGGWESIALGVARRRKGDKRNPELAGALALYRALAGATERHREAYERQFPGFFPKTPAQVREARAAVQHAHKQVDVAAEEIGKAQAAAYRANKAAKILEAGPQIVDCGEGRTVVEAWSVVAGRALAILRGESYGED